MVTIRPATQADLPQIIALDQEIFGAYGADESSAVIQARLEVFPAGCAVVQETEAAGSLYPLLGYLTTEKWSALREPTLDEDPKESHQAQGTVLNITTLAINPAYQNRGLGGLLIRHVFDLARREACLDIVLETAHAERFYLRHGFVRSGVRVQRGIPLYIMHCDLRNT
ncbi:MAG: N-acetyltransferase [Caldilineaceae bacterium]